MSHISCQGGSAEFFAPPCFPIKTPAGTGIPAGGLFLLQSGNSLAAVSSSSLKKPLMWPPSLTAWANSPPTGSTVRSPAGWTFPSRMKEVPAEAEGGEGQPRHGGDTADIWGQGLVAEQAAAGLRPGVVRLKVLAEHIIVRHKAGDLHGE